MTYYEKLEKNAQSVTISFLLWNLRFFLSDTIPYNFIRLLYFPSEHTINNNGIIAGSPEEL